MRRLAFALLMAALMVGCGDSAEGSSAAESSSSAAAPTEPAPPPEPTPEELALERFEGGELEAACEYLVARDFSPELCAWILTAAKGERTRGLSADQFSRFLRSQKVRRRRGRVQGWFNEAQNSYEIRLGGAPAVLIATSTEFETTGSFRMWVQEQEPRRVEMQNGNVRHVRVFEEWELYGSIHRVGEIRGREESAPEARALLNNLLHTWESEFRYRDPTAVPDGVEVPSAPQAMQALREILPTEWDSESVTERIGDVVDYLDDSGLRYAELSEFPRTSRSKLSGEPEAERGKAWVASGTVIRVENEGLEHPAIVFWRGNTCTYAVVPSAVRYSKYDEVRFAGIAVQPYRWRNLRRRRVPCLVAVGYLR